MTLALAGGTNDRVNQVELLPSLEHCIETTARDEFWSSVSRYLEDGLGDRELEGKIELLKAFLEWAGFGSLRSQSEKYLLEGKKVRFVVRWQEGRIDCRMVVGGDTRIGGS
ncbi:MAG: hypothetical protein ACNA7X_00720 [Dehalococcoidia bacterium]